MMLITKIAVLVLTVYTCSSYYSLDVWALAQYERGFFYDLHNFVLELQKNSSDTLDFVSKIQAMFCPEQPICGRTEIQKSRNILATLPEYLPIEHHTVRTENISAVVGLCCYPYSCTCEVDDNCCPTKRVNNNSTKKVNNNTTKRVNTTQSSPSPQDFQ